MFFNNLEGDALVAYKKLEANLKQQGMTELKLRADQIIIRDLRPEDIGLTRGRFTSTMTTLGSWNKMINTYSVGDNKFIGLYGVFYAKSSGDGAITQLRVKGGTSDLRYWNIQGINMTENAQRYFEDPVIVGQNQILTIEGFVPNASANTSKAEDMVLLGKVVERKGILINPD